MYKTQRQQTATSPTTPPPHIPTTLNTKNIFNFKKSVHSSSVALCQKLGPIPRIVVVTTITLIQGGIFLLA